MADTCVARTTAGAVRGVSDGAVATFHAVPYAEPPLGPLRFAAPRAHTPWLGERDCTTVGSSFPQGPSRLNAVIGHATIIQSEDSLTLTVWTPAADDKRRPVLIWLHGGAYQSGAGNLPHYSGAWLAKGGDIVVVGVNYRLGGIGYLYLPEAEAAANRGLLDQMQALTWVHENIAAFGGDPGNITVAGQSAGGGSVLALLANNGSRKLIRRAIAQSPTCSTLTPEKAAEITARFYVAAGVQPGDIGRLTEMPAAEIVAAHRKVQLDIAATGDRMIACQIVAPGNGCPVASPGAIAQGAAADVPLLIGSTLDEGHAWLGQEERLVAAETFDAVEPLARASKFLEAAADLPAERRAAARRPWQLLSAMLTWAVFEKPSLRIADGRAKTGGATYVYRFDWRPTRDARFGACHCIEIPFMLDNIAGWPKAVMLDGHDPASQQALARRMSRAWVAFARTGNPTTPELAWPVWSDETRQRMVLDDDCRVVAETR